MNFTISVIQMSMILTGFILVWIASTKRTQAHPYHSNADSVHLFKRRSWYTPVGYKLHVTGMLLFYNGLLVGSLILFW